MEEDEEMQFKENIFNSKEDESKSCLKKTGSNSILNSLSKVPSNQSYRLENSFKKTQSSMLHSIK
jgi:hypothetical protein